jgi:hypothetical protein
MEASELREKETELRRTGSRVATTKGKGSGGRDGMRIRMYHHGAPEVWCFMKTTDANEREHQVLYLFYPTVKKIK